MALGSMVCHSVSSFPKDKVKVMVCTSLVKPMRSCYKQKDHYTYIKITACNFKSSRATALKSFLKAK